MRRTSAFADKVRDFANLTKPAIDIQLADEQNGPIHTYSTFDQIDGTVTITAPLEKEIKVDDLEIAFVGSTKTYVDKMTTSTAVSGRTEAFVQFLKLEQPFSPTALPSDRILKPGQSITFPFHFIIPDRLLPTSCRHKTGSEKLKDAHLCLSPSVGDAAIAGRGSTLLDDLAPSMVRTQYGVRVRLFKLRRHDQKELLITDATKKVRVVPASEEAPPITISPSEDAEYCMRREKKIRKGLFKGRAGCVMMQAAQPMSFRLPPPRAEDTAPPSTMVTVQLRFDPTSANCSPPKLGQLNSRLKAASFFASAPMAEYPSKSSILFDTTQAVYVDSVALASRNMQTAQWERHEAGTNDPQHPPASEIACKDKNKDLPYFTASLLVPLSLPAQKAWVPTYHACISARIYILELSLSLQSYASASLPNTLTLKLPIQVSAETSARMRTGSEVLVALDGDDVARMVDVEEEAWRAGSISMGGAGGLPTFDESNEEAARRASAPIGGMGDLPPEYFEGSFAGGGHRRGVVSAVVPGDAALPGFHINR